MADRSGLAGPYDVGARMRHTDAFAWRMETDPRLRSTVVAIWLLDRPPRFDHVLSRLDRASRVVPVFRQRVVEPPLRLGPPHFELDPNFDLSWHVRRIAAPPPGDVEAVLAYAAKLPTAAFDPARPLWEVTVIEGLAGGGAAMVAKFHHSLADGIGGIQLAEYLFDATREVPDDGALPPEPHSPPTSRYAGALSLARTLASVGGIGLSASVHSVVHPLRSVVGSLDAARSVAKTVRPMAVTLSPVMTGRSLSRALGVVTVGQADLMRAGHAAGCSLNDAYVAALCGALRRYHERTGEVPDELRVNMPISVRREGDQVGGNRITLARFRIPVAERDPAVRMKLFRERSEQWQHERSLPLTQQIAAALNVVPRSYLQQMLAHVDVLASNVHGPDHPQYIGGARVLAEYAFGPTIGAAVNVTMITYEGVCYVGSSADLRAVLRHDDWLRSLREGFDEVIAIDRRQARVVRAGGDVA